mmetsp:Transcript_16003/g.31282  ORF Transcript_16003/g.31282 Transcript_16003/m.31282 type:complete len:109 (+) Transcript_16003:431-757(+)
MSPSSKAAMSVTKKTSHGIEKQLMAFHKDTVIFIGFRCFFLLVRGRLASIYLPNNCWHWFFSPAENAFVVSISLESTFSVLELPCLAHRRFSMFSRTTICLMPTNPPV